MAADDHSGGRPAGPVVLRIKLRYDDLDAMVQRFAPNVGKSGLFLPTKSIQPVGTEVKFELRLANDVAVLVGLGRVKHVRAPDPAKPRAAFGMAIELMRVSREGREVIIRMIERRRALGLADVAIPMPDDIEAARRAEVETQPRAETSAVVRDAMSQLASAPIAEQVLTAPQPASGPIAVAKEAPIAVAKEAPIAVAKQESSRGSSPLLTAPRRDSGPIGVTREDHSARIPVPVLAPEKSRPRRPRVQELIDRAGELSAPMIAALPVPELDMHVDIENVLTRARSLAGGELEVELAALREAAAAPQEINIEAASAELARSLGGKAIARRDRSGSARWAPPPSVTELRAKIQVVVEPAPVAEPTFSTKTRAETEAAPSAAIAAVVDAAIEGSPSIVPEESYVIRPSTPTYEESGFRDALPPGIIDDAGDDDAFVANETTTTAVDAVEDPLDVDTQRPRTRISEVLTEPSQTGLLIDDDADVSSFERALDAARIHTGVSAPAPERAEDPDLESEPVVLAEPHERTQIGAFDRAFEQAGFGEPAAEEPSEEEISDLDVLAEADEEDADLLGAHGEADASSAHVAPAPDDDFAARLDLGDDDEPPPSEEFDREAARQFDEDVRAPSYADQVEAYPPPQATAPPQAYVPEHDYIEPIRTYPTAPPVEHHRAPRHRRPSSEFPDPPSSSYTFAESYPEAALDIPEEPVGEDFDEPHSYARPQPQAQPQPARPVGPDPRLLRHGRATTAGTEDLEDALAALDVDFDDLSNLKLERKRRPTPSTSSGRPLPGLPMESTGSRALPGLPVERPRDQQTGPSRTAAPPVAAAPVAAAPVARPPVKGGTRPPPIPAAARKPPTQQVPLVRAPIKRAVTDDEGVLIDFDEDE
jgi:hypothetical protein